MKSFLTSFLFFAIAKCSIGQVVTQEDFKSVIPYLQKEDFKGAFEKTNQLLGTTRNDSSDLRGIVTYMNIYAAAGMVALHDITHEEFLLYAKKFVGQRLVMPGRPCIDSTLRSFNALRFIKKDGKLQGTITSANSDGTTILSFEYFKFNDTVSPSDLIGKNVRCGGILEEVEINPNHSTIWISRLRISKAFAKTMN